MAYTTIDFPAEYFNTVLYTGNGSTQSITGVGFKPDFVWIKTRSNTYTHLWYDIIRGAGKYLQSPSTGAEGGDSGDLLGSFNTDGFQVNNTLTGGTNTSTNGTSSTFVSWNWLGANTTVSNTSGTITSTVSANTTSGFSIVSYTGNASNSTVGHSLGTTPSMIIVKNRSAVEDWTIYHSTLGNTKFLDFTTGASQTSSTIWNNTSPTSTLFTVGTNSKVNGNTNNMIAYCFAEVKGYSKFGSYTGNGSTDGTFVYTGFKPAFVMIKGSSNGGDNWFTFDNKRTTYNVITKLLYPNANDAELDASSRAIDFLSNGFKLRNSDTSLNYSGWTYIYMAFAENPFVSSKGIPSCAR